MAALSATTPVFAESLSGNYLAARHAAAVGNFEEAAAYFERALQKDPSNPEMRERAILANMSLGKIDAAAALGASLAKDGHSSQLAHMSLIAQAASQENYATILASIEDKRGFGPLADGLLGAWAQLGGGDMSAAIGAFDEVSKLPGLGAFASYHKALAFVSVGDFQSAEALYSTNPQGGMERTRRGLIIHAKILSQLDRNADALELLDAAFGQSFDPGLSALRESLEAGETLAVDEVTSPRDGMAEVFFTLASALSNEDNDDVTLLYSRTA